SVDDLHVNDLPQPVAREILDRPDDRRVIKFVDAVFVLEQLRRAPERIPIEEDQTERQPDQRQGRRDAREQALGLDIVAAFVRDLRRRPLRFSLRYYGDWRRAGVSRGLVFADFGDCRFKKLLESVFSVNTDQTAQRRRDADVASED